MANKNNDKESPYKMPNGWNRNSTCAEIPCNVMLKPQPDPETESALIFNEQDSEILAIVYEWHERNG